MTKPKQRPRARRQPDKSARPGEEARSPRSNRPPSAAKRKRIAARAVIEDDGAGPFFRKKVVGSREVLRFDVRRRAGGTFFGGDKGRSVVCSQCQRAGIALSPTRRKDGLHERVAHVLVFYIDARNEVFVDYAERCIAGDARPVVENEP